MTGGAARVEAELACICVVGAVAAHESTEIDKFALLPFPALPFTAGDWESGCGGSRWASDVANDDDADDDDDDDDAEGEINEVATAATADEELMT